MNLFSQVSACISEILQYFTQIQYDIAIEVITIQDRVPNQYHLTAYIYENVIKA